MMNCKQLIENYIQLEKEPTKEIWNGECCFHEKCTIMVTEHGWLCGEGTFGDAAEWFVRLEGLPTDMVSALRLWQTMEKRTHGCETGG